ncbi:MAG: type II toxin-antitoxin system HigB family toxin [Sediminibacterium sp.]
MRVIAKKTIKNFWINYSDCEQQLKTWYQEATDSNWKSPADIKRLYPSASILADNRVVFNIKGNTYRIVVRINYDYSIIWIRFIGTHAQYDKIDATKI